MIKILEKDFESFFRVPFEVRGQKSLYAAPFKPDLKKMLSTKNPIFKSESDFTFYTAVKDNVPVGRITAHVHHAFNKRFNTNKCYFGFFECINDQSVADELFRLADKFAIEKGYDTLSGNFNLTAMQEMGVMISGFENEPYIAQSYGMPWYPELMTNAGYVPTFPMTTFEIDLLTVNPEEVASEKHRKLLTDSEYEIIPITKSAYAKYRPVILEIFNKGFDQNPLFVPISTEEFDFQAKDLVYFMDSHISFVAAHNGVPVAISISIPDINPLLRATGSKLNFATLYHFIKCKLKRERTLCIFAAVLPEYQNKGMLGAIIYQTLNSMKKRGYKKFGITSVADGNKGSLRKMEATNARKLHELRIFEKQFIAK
ncbi:MAG: GNAT family N-acetyltransferase [Bacteroidia bacterium]